MKNFLQLSTFLALSLALCVMVAPAAKPSLPGLEVICDPFYGENSVTGNCFTGMITFTGTGFGKNTNVVVTDITDPSTPEVIDSSRYTADQGVLTFVESLEPAGTYQIVLGKGKNATTIEITVDELL